MFKELWLPWNWQDSFVIAIKIALVHSRRLVVKNS
jgi:hypothetical protein